MLNFYPKKESRFSRKLETLFWWIVRLAPVLIVVLGMWSDNNGGYDLYQAVEMLTGGIYTGPDNFIFWTFEEIFAGGNGIFNVIASQAEPFYCFVCWLFLVELARLLLDVLLFIPRLARKWINLACQED